MVRFTYKYLKSVALFLTVVFLFQCCKAYDLQTTQIEKAVGPQKKYVKIITADNKEYLFDSIYYKNDALYGIMRKSTKKNILEIELQEDQINEVYIYVLNPEKSKKKTRVAILVPASILFVFGVLFIYAMASFELQAYD